VTNSNSNDLMPGPDAPPRLPVAVIGCGRMGKHHARIYAQMPAVKLVGVFDANVRAAQAVAAEFGCRAFAGLDEVLGQARAVTIAVPTIAHAAVAKKCLARSIACLIEKPLAADVAECQQIVEWGRQAAVAVQVGHVERFNPAVRALEKLALVPRFIETSRISPMTFRSIDVGVVLDLMIHDIDVVLKLAGGTVTRCEAVGASVIGPVDPAAGQGVEDVCNARLTFDNGCVANLTASRLALSGACASTAATPSSPSTSRSAAAWWCIGRATCRRFAMPPRASAPAKWPT
jgi:predicted dehydrogenase